MPVLSYWYKALQLSSDSIGIETEVTAPSGPCSCQLITSKQRLMHNRLLGYIFTLDWNILVEGVHDVNHLTVFVLIFHVNT